MKIVATKMKGGEMVEQIVFHIDVNSAFVSWTATKMVAEGKDDIRKIPSIIGGDPNSRRSVVTAISIPAKKYGIKVGEPVSMALRKCPGLFVAKGDFETYRSMSKAFKSICNEYSPVMEEFSIDECFLDMSGMQNIYPDIVKTAYEIKDRIKKELGFTVNVGVGSNKLLAKMASDFEKPDKVHTLFMDEVKTKMWPLPVGDLLFVGKKSKGVLEQHGIRTIGDLAQTKIEYLTQLFGEKAAMSMHSFANGISHSKVSDEKEESKGISVSTTLEENVTTKEEAYKIFLKLTDQIGNRMRKMGCKTSCVAVTIRDTEFRNKSHQRMLVSSTDITNEIYEEVKELFDLVWDGKTPLRLLKVAVSHLDHGENEQYSLFIDPKKEKEKKMDQAMDALRDRFGKTVISRGSLYDKDSHF